MNIHLFYELATKILTNEASEKEKLVFEEYLHEPEYTEIYEWLRAEWQKELKIQSDEFNLESGLKRLREKIRQSDELEAKKGKTIRLRRWSQTAAAVLLLLAALRMLLPQIYSESDISKFADNNINDVKTGDTRLILENKKEVVIESDDSRIDYTSGSGNVVVDNKKTIEQKLDENTPTYNTVIVPYGKRSKVILADNSEVWLNSGTRFIYPAHFTKEKREVFLEGEALFEVQHDDEKPFVVVTNSIEVEVLGTVFNVCAYADDANTETVLERGSVAIRSKTDNLLQHSKVTITPGTLAEYNPATNKINQRKVNTELYTSWRDGYLVCEHEPLAKILKKLTRYYNHEIHLGDTQLEQLSFSGKLDLKDNAQKVLETIAFVSSLQIEKRNNELIIKN